MVQVIWTEPALADLHEIAEYIALDKPSAARALVAEVVARVERLEKFPRSGKRPPELPRDSRYRELVIKPCRVFYRIEKSKVYMLYIMRSERLLRQYILAERF